jgi:POT family proton-dependent oligopeptide transporter
MLLIPLTSYGLYPAISRVFPLTALRKISIGFFITVPAFLIPAYLESQISMGLTPSIGWQALAYVVMTTAEVFISITCLEFSYTQAPNKMKSLVMSIYLLSMSIGNAFTAGVNFFIQNPDGSSKLEGASYYTFFASLMFITAILFIFVAARYKVQNHIQDSDPES